ncbi:hypothetical protein H6P81_019477 [Aristolochia fimbriata]|uniref:Uncharacterized protein n=1 Tax=Aristolochia fimbriata TaxID=158543 RepID=A0AAV7DRW5_ARIFI|nr:hypothetical protein H6P81_019477 [Aristolochia fimbriata]
MVQFPMTLGSSEPLLDSLLEDASEEFMSTKQRNRNGGFPLGHKLQTEVDNLDSPVFGGQGIGGQSETGFPSQTSKIRGMTVAYSSFSAVEGNVCCNENKDKTHEHARGHGHDTVESQKAISEGGLTQIQGKQSAEKVL